MNIDNRQQFLVTPAVAEDLARRYRESCERRRAAAQARQLSAPSSPCSLADQDTPLP